MGGVISASTHECAGRVNAGITGIDAGHPFRLAELPEAVIGHDGGVDSGGWFTPPVCGLRD